MSALTSKFSSNLKRMRKSRNLTQKDFAKLLGYSEKAVSKWECGSSIPSIDTLFNIAKILQVNVETMFNDEEIYFLGIDGGGTKTDFILADCHGKVINTLKTDACNPMDIGIDATENILKTAIYEICQNIPLSSVYTFAGIAGGTSGDMQQKLSSFFANFGFAKFRNDSDNLNIIAAGLGNEDGITVIMGTGVCAYIQKNSRHKRLAGWGYLIDNGGSGYNIGRDGLNAYFCSIDGMGDKTRISEEVDKLYPGGHTKIMEYIYKHGKKAVASFAPAVFTSAEQGDNIAQKIINKNVEFIAKLIATASKEFYEDKVNIVIAGGLTKQKIIIDYLKNILPNCNKYKIRILDTEPVYGALKPAQQLMEDNKND